MRKFLKTVPMKLWLLLTAVVLFAFFSNDFGLVDIQKTAIILAAAIDKTEGEFALTSQIAMPKGSDRTTGGTSSVEIRTEGLTVSDCVTGIQTKTGWVPKLVFCDLLLLGEEAAKEDVTAQLNYFLRNEYMPDSCLMAVCAGNAGEMLSSESAIDDASSLAIEKLFSDSAQKSGKVVTNTLKDFAIGQFGPSESSYLPFLRMSDQEGAQDSSAGSGAGNTGGASGASGTSEAAKIYTADETALFSKGKMVGLLPQEETLAFCLLRGKVFAGTFDARDGEEPITLTVLQNKGSVSLKEDRVRLGIGLKVRLCCRGAAAPLEDVAGDIVSEQGLESAKALLSGYVESLWEICRESGCDLFNLKRTLYRTSLKRYSERKDSLFETVRPEIDVQVRSKN